jgi:hypothetical protein
VADKTIWNEIGLKQNPFEVTQEKDANNLTWAGLKSIKSEFDKLIINSLTSENSRVVLNMSRWGGGKTHTALYYSNPGHFPRVDFNYKKPLYIFTVTPREANTAVNEFYTKIVESIGITRIAETIKAMRCHNKKEGKEDSVLRIFQDWCGSEDIGRILYLLGHEQENEKEDISFEASSFFFNDKPGAALKRKLKVRRGIESTHDKFVVISTLFKILSYFDESGRLEPKRRIFLWLDEIEAFIWYSTKHMTVFSQALRELIDMTPNFLNLIMNFSYADTESISTLDFLIGGALKSRVTEKILHDELKIDEALEYVRELLGYFRTGDVLQANPYFPFDEEALQLLFEKLVNKLKEPLMPRTINNWCRRVIEKGISEKYLNEKGLIDKVFIAQLDFFNEAMKPF